MSVPDQHHDPHQMYPDQQHYYGHYDHANYTGPMDHQGYQQQPDPQQQW